MTQTMDCPEARLSLGVYVLGSIDPAERTLIDTHLENCPECRGELAGLEGLPALLAQVPAAEAIALAADDGPPPSGARQEEQAPPELLATVLDLTAARRRRRRLARASLGVAAALIVAVGVFGGVRLGTTGAPPSAAGAQRDPGPASGPWHDVTTSAQGVAATVAFRPMGWGTQLAVKVSGIPRGTDCQLWVTGSGGDKILAGSWVTDAREGTVWYPGSTDMSGSGLQGFTIVVGTHGSLTLPV